MFLANYTKICLVSIYNITGVVAFLFLSCTSVKILCKHIAIKGGLSILCSVLNTRIQRGSHISYRNNIVVLNSSTVVAEQSSSLNSIADD